MSPHYLVKCITFSSDCRYVAFLQTLVALKKASCRLALMALKRTGCDVWQMECQASNVTANVQSDHLLQRHMLPVFFALINCIVHHTVLKFSPYRNKTPTTRPYHGSVLDTHEKHEKMKKLCSLQGSAVTFIRCDAKGVTVCFLLR